MSKLSQIITKYQSRAEVYEGIFDGITTAVAEQINVRDTPHNFQPSSIHNPALVTDSAKYGNFKKYYLTLYIINEKLKRIASDSRDQDIFEAQKKQTIDERNAIKEAFLTEFEIDIDADSETPNNNPIAYARLKTYLDKFLAEKRAHRNFLISRFGKFSAIAFAVGNGLGLAMVGYMIANGLGSTALMIAGFVIGSFVIIGLNVALLYFASERNSKIKSEKDKDEKIKKHVFTLIALDCIAIASFFFAESFGFLPQYGLTLLLGSLALGAFFTLWANFDVTRDNNHKFLISRLDQHNHKTDVSYTPTQKLALLIAAGMVFVASLVGGYFAYGMVLELLTETSLSNFFAYDAALSFSTILGIGSFFTIGIVFYHCAKNQILSASDFSYLIHLKDLILADKVDAENIDKKSGIEKAIIQAKSEDAYKNSQYKTFRNYAALFGVFALPVVVIVGAIFQQFAIIDLLAESLREGLFSSTFAMSSNVQSLAEALCIVAGLSYVFMFVPAAIGTVIKLAYGIPRVGGYDELTPEAKVRFQLKRAGNTVMNGLEATLGAMLVFNSITAIVFITVFAMITSFVMSDIEGKRDRVTDKLGTAQDDLYQAEVKLKEAKDAPFTFTPSKRLTYGYDAMLAYGLDNCDRVDEKGDLVGDKKDEHGNILVSGKVNLKQHLVISA